MKRGWSDEKRVNYLRGSWYTDFMHEAMANLLYDSWVYLRSLLGLTTPYIIIFMVGIPLVVFFINIFLKWHKREDGVKTMRQAIKDSFLSKGTLIPLGVCVLAWMALLGWSIVNTIYVKNAAKNTIIKNLGDEIRNINNQKVNKVKPAPQTKAQQDEDALSLEKERKRKYITDTLADFRIRGLHIQNQCSMDAKAARKLYEQWDIEVDTFAIKNLTKADTADLSDVYSISVDREPPQPWSLAEHTWVFVGRKIKRIEQVSKKYERH